MTSATSRSSQATEAMAPAIWIAATARSDGAVTSRPTAVVVADEMKTQAPASTAASQPPDVHDARPGEPRQDPSQDDERPGKPPDGAQAIGQVRAAWLHPGGAVHGVAGRFGHGSRVVDGVGPVNGMG